jgi:hypothetical protein
MDYNQSSCFHLDACFAYVSKFVYSRFACPMQPNLLQLRSLEGIRYIYTQNIYIYAFMVVVLVTLVVVLVRGPDKWKRRKPEDVYQ